MQQKQGQWAWQWNNMYDDERWLFEEWIRPNTFETFRGKDVLDCGCGGGQHINFTAPYAKTVTGVDLNALSSASKNTKDKPNVTLVEEDIAVMDLKRKFDVVYCIGVLHHTDDPTASFKNIANHANQGGRVIVWVYSTEGNAINRFIVEPMKTCFVRFLPRRAVLWMSHILTAILYIPIYTVYLLPLRFLPFYEYFQNWRRLSFFRNSLNVFDKLNAPQTIFISRAVVEKWFKEGFTDVSISPYMGVSWSASGTKL